MKGLGDWPGKLMVALGIIAAILALLAGTAAARCTERLNHSGVLECHIGPYDGPMPVEFMTVDTSSVVTL